MEELKAASIKEENISDIEPTKPEALTVEELQNILRSKAKAVQLTLVAEKAVAEARVAELEAQNLILLTYNKYQLNQQAGDNITENGLIHRSRKNGENNGQ